MVRLAFAWQGGEFLAAAMADVGNACLTKPTFLVISAETTSIV